MRVPTADLSPGSGLALRHRVITVSIAGVLFLGAVVLASGIERVHASLNEGDLMYMP